MTCEDSIVSKLKLLLEYYPVAFYDLVSAARVKDDKHKVYLATADILRNDATYNSFIRDNVDLDEAVVKTVAARVRGKGARLRILEDSTNANQ